MILGGAFDQCRISVCYKFEPEPKNAQTLKVQGYRGDLAGLSVSFP